MFSLSTSMTRPSGAMWSSLARISAVEQRLVTSNNASRRFEAVSSGPTTRKFAASALSFITSRGIRVELHHVAQHPAHYARGFRHDGAGLGHVHGIVAEIGHLEIAKEQAAVGVRVVAHAPLAFGRQFPEFRNERAASVEQLLGPVALHPVFQHLQVGGLGGQLGERHLVRAEGPFDLDAIHHLWSGPAFGRAQHDHGPERAPSEGAGAGSGIALDGPDLGDDFIERGCHELVHRVGIVAFDEKRLVAVAVEKGRPVFPPHGGPPRGDRRSCTRSGAGWEARRRRAPGSGICWSANWWPATRFRLRHRPPRSTPTGPDCRTPRRRRAAGSSPAPRPREWTRASPARRGWECRRETKTA